MQYLVRMQEKSIKVVIEHELSKETPNWRLIESLTRSEIDQDPDNVRFSVDAGHIQRLGVELVGKQDTALSELIKNAYDADASSVDLIFSNNRKAGGTLVISDNGSGMSMDVIRNSWMRISTDTKAEQPLSPIFHRKRAGRKGIGRFAVQRLGETLELITKPAGEAFGYSVNFDWDTEFKAGRDLNEVFNDVTRFAKPEKEQGTELRINNLRDPWSASAISRVWRAVLLLQPPFKIASIEGKVAGKRADPGFLVRVDGHTNETRTDSFSIENDFLNQAIAKIEARIEPDGKAWVRVISKKLGLDDKQDFDENYGELGPVELTSSYFIYSPDALSGMKQNDAIRMGQAYGGIRVYRNGFRVLPYGEPSDDWLGLDSAVARRVFIAPGNNRNFFGQVSIDSEKNPDLDETASREGLQENDAFDLLRKFSSEALIWALKRVAAMRNRKQSPSQPGFVSEVRPASDTIQTAIELIEGGSKPETDQGAAGDEGTQGPPKPDPAAQAALRALRLAREDAKASEEEAARRKQATLQYEAMLRLLASLGLSISVFGHEVKGAQEAIRARLQLLHEEADALPKSEERAGLLEQLEKLELSTGRLFDIGGYIAGLMSKTESRDLRELSVGGALERFTTQFESYMSKQRVKFDPPAVTPSNLRTIEMHASEFDSVLLNFLTNSIKSMKKAKVSKRKIRMDARQEGDFVIVGFEDNGAGIVEEQQNQIFDAFFTTTLTADDDGVSGPGTGLGLKIVADIAESYGGSVAVVEPSDGFNCRIEFKILASEAEE